MEAIFVSTDLLFETLHLPSPTNGKDKSLKGKQNIWKNPKPDSSLLAMDVNVLPQRGGVEVRANLPYYGEWNSVSQFPCLGGGY